MNHKGNTADLITQKKFWNKCGILKCYLSTRISISSVFFGFMMLLSFIIKGQLMAADATAPLFLAVFQHDSAIFGGILLLFVVSCLIDQVKLSQASIRHIQRFFVIAVRFLILSVATIYIVDAIIYKFFNTRFYAEDVVHYSRETEAVLSELAAAGKILLKKPIWKISIFFIIIFSSIFFASRFLIARASKKIRWHATLLIVAFIFIGIYLMPTRLYTYSYQDKLLYENIFERNKNYLNRKKYSSEFRNRVLSSFHEKQINERGRNIRPNILLLIIESLSSHHSLYFSGINDFTPNLDHLAKQNITIPNFFANGWTTVGGLVSLLTGAFPIAGERAKYGRWGGVFFKDFELTDTLPNYLRKFEYHSYFFCSGDLSFVGQNEWLKGIGFETIKGGEAPEYEGERRGGFKSVLDGVLYKLVLKEIKKMPQDKPCFICVETLWSHFPYFSPTVGGEDSAENVFRYTDEQINYFCSALEDMGFFRNGILIITGDHRSLDPISKKEWDTFGLRAQARIPMVIVWKSSDLPKVIKGDFQQADLFASIKSIVSDRYSRSIYHGNFLEPNPIAPPCIFQARADDRDLIYVKCGEEEGLVKIDGDRTRFVSGNVHENSFVVDKINHDRITRGNEPPGSGGERVTGERTVTVSPH